MYHDANFTRNWWRLNFTILSKSRIKIHLKYTHLNSNWPLYSIFNYVNWHSLKPEDTTEEDQNIWSYKSFACKWKRSIKPTGGGKIVGKWHAVWRRGNNDRQEEEEVTERDRERHRLYKARALWEKEGTAEWSGRGRDSWCLPVEESLWAYQPRAIDKSGKGSKSLSAIKALREPLLLPLIYSQTSFIYSALWFTILD